MPMDRATNGFAPSKTSSPSSLPISLAPRSSRRKPNLSFCILARETVCVVPVFLISAFLLLHLDLLLIGSPLSQAVPVELTSLGYTHQLCVDFSSVVVEMMTKRHAEIPGIEWKQADVRDLKILADESIDVALDKSTLDAMIYGSIWNPPDEVKINTGRYMREVHRVLKNDGMFLYITFRQAHLIRPLLNPDGRLWDMKMQILQSEEGTFPYYGYVIRKKT